MKENKVNVMKCKTYKSYCVMQEYDVDGLVLTHWSYVFLALTHQYNPLETSN